MDAKTHAWYVPQGTLTQMGKGWDISFLTAFSNTESKQKGHFTPIIHKLPEPFSVFKSQVLTSWGFENHSMAYFARFIFRVYDLWTHLPFDVGRILLASINRVWFPGHHRDGRNVVLLDFIAFRWPGHGLGPISVWQNRPAERWRQKCHWYAKLHMFDWIIATVTGVVMEIFRR